VQEKKVLNRVLLARGAREVSGQEGGFIVRIMAEKIKDGHWESTKFVGVPKLRRALERISQAGGREAQFWGCGGEDKFNRYGVGRERGKGRSPAVREP